MTTTRSKPKRKQQRFRQVGPESMTKVQKEKKEKREQQQQEEEEGPKGG